MLNEKMLSLGKKSSVIREIFEYGRKRKAEIGAENVYDFSLGNPSISAPDNLTQTLISLINEKEPVSLHGYTSAPGDYETRKTISDYINDNFGIKAQPELIYMTCGAAASLTVSLNALVNKGDEVIVLAPFFPEYRVFAENAGANLVVVPCNIGDFSIDFYALEKAITEKTKAIIVNSPNNPTGAVFTEEEIKRLSDLLNKKQNEFSNNIFIICDEPYRELVYSGVKVPYIPSFYNNTIVCYSFSKSMSIPGERIGYIFVSPSAFSAKDIFASVCGAGRALGFVCAPSLMQYAVAKCIGKTSDISQYEENRNILYNCLKSMGFEAVVPQGAFYLFVKALEEDAYKFCEEAKKYELLLVPSDDFGVRGYVRISYCVSRKQIIDSMPSFKKLYDEYKR